MVKRSNLIGCCSAASLLPLACLSAKPGNCDCPSRETGKGSSYSTDLKNEVKFRMFHSSCGVTWNKLYMEQTNKQIIKLKCLKTSPVPSFWGGNDPIKAYVYFKIKIKWYLSILFWKMPKITIMGCICRLWAPKTTKNAEIKFV